MSARSEHILPVSLYLAIAGILMVMTVVTVWAAGIDFGGWNVVIALLIATVKASLVALYFMHLKYDNPFYAFVFVCSLLFLATFISLIMFDTLRRDDIYEIRGSHVQEEAIIYRETPVTSGAAPAVEDADSAAAPTETETTETGTTGEGAESDAAPATEQH